MDASRRSARQLLAACCWRPLLRAVVTFGATVAGPLVYYHALWEGPEGGAAPAAPHSGLRGRAPGRRTRTPSV
ncbi:hypothetical protein DSC45_24375 [Streptomyces sp. YIM 130001]|nr:hypothetical protein DSC45_24375 [Streptomyces sp. YIM 130001]